jgi:hypothetical protein
VFPEPVLQDPVPTPDTGPEKKGLLLATVRTISSVYATAIPPRSIYLIFILTGFKPLFLTLILLRLCCVPFVEDDKKKLYELKEWVFAKFGNEQLVLAILVQTLIPVLWIICILAANDRWDMLFKPVAWAGFLVLLAFSFRSQ